MTISRLTLPVSTETCYELQTVLMTLLKVVSIVYTNRFIAINDVNDGVYD